MLTKQNEEMMHGEGLIVYITRSSDKAVTTSNIENVSDFSDLMFMFQ